MVVQEELYRKGLVVQDPVDRLNLLEDRGVEVRRPRFDGSRFEEGGWRRKRRRRKGGGGGGGGGGGRGGGRSRPNHLERGKGKQLQP